MPDLEPSHPPLLVRSSSAMMVAFRLGSGGRSVLSVSVRTISTWRLDMDVEYILPRLGNSAIMT